MPTQEPTDGEIIERMRAGEIGAFSRLVERYQGPLLALACNRLGHRDLAEDAVQEAFLCAFRWLDSYDSQYAFRTWLWTILLNQCRRTAEKEHRAEVLRTGFAETHSGLQSDETNSPSERIELQESGKQLRQALKKLPEAHADAVRLRFFGGLKFEAIAQATGCSLRTAKYRVKEGLLKLGAMLARRIGLKLRNRANRQASAFHQARLNMRCDDVFEILTSGPFPNGSSTDEAVEQHLCACHECRSFAEAMRPIASIATESDLPTYNGRIGEQTNGHLSPSLVNRVQILVQREHEDRIRKKKSSSAASRSGAAFIAVCAAVCLFGAAATFGSQLWVTRGKFDASLATTNPHIVSPTSVQCNSSLLSSIKTNGVIPVKFMESADACCLNCHGGQARGREKRQESIGLVVMSCQKCHQEKSTWVRL